MLLLNFIINLDNLLLLTCKLYVPIIIPYTELTPATPLVLADITHSTAALGIPRTVHNTYTVYSVVSARLWYTAYRHTSAALK